MRGVEIQVNNFLCVEWKCSISRLKELAPRKKCGLCKISKYFFLEAQNLPLLANKAHFDLLSLIKGQYLSIKINLL